MYPSSLRKKPISTPEGPGFPAYKFFSLEEAKDSLPLFPNLKLLDQSAIALHILALEIIEEMPPLPYQFQQPSARMMIFHVGLKMFGQIIDSFAQDGDLNLRRPCIRSMPLVVLDDDSFLFGQ
jgi:hypothetical protein